MLKEIKNIFYLFTIFFLFFFVIKFYFSEKNIKRNNNIMFQHQKEVGKKFNNLPIIENDTKDIIMHTNEIEDFKNKKQRKFWNLID